MQSQLERMLWDDLVKANLVLPEQQSRKPWAGTGRLFRADFCWPEHNLLVEVNGGTWNGGRHTRGAGVERDYEKLNLAVLAGFRVLLFTSRQVRSGQAAEFLRRLLPVAEPPPVQSPLHLSHTTLGGELSPDLGGCESP
jgi:very-short-patch-repair endonuclease